MSVLFACPACGASAAVIHNIPERCPRCGIDLPTTLRSSLEAARLKDLSPLPALLWVGRFGTAGFGGMATLFLFLAPFDIGSYSIGAEQVSGPEFLREAGAVFGVLGLLMLATAYALWTERSWGRWAMMLYWPVVAISMFFTPAETTGNAAAGAFFSLVAGLIAWWYLFGKENVVAYYERLERQEDASANASG